MKASSGPDSIPVLLLENCEPELESDLQDTVDWGTKWLVDFIAGKIQLVSFDQSNNTGATDVKMGVFFSVVKIIF